MAPEMWTTAEAASKVGITRATVQDWIKKKKFAPPELMRIGNGTIRLWSASDIARLRAAKKDIYQEKRPKKK
jgi:predicted DNA-binding transcriptional regulator AlpA